MLDSSTVIAAERRRQPIPEFLESIFEAYGPIKICLIEELFRLVPVHPVTSHTGWLLGKIEGEEAASGNVLPFNDLMIAAAAIEQGYAVLTNNLRHFRKIPGIRVLSL